MSRAQDIAQEYTLTKQQIPDLRHFCECEDSNGRPYWVSNRVYKTQEGARRLIVELERNHTRRYVVYTLTVRYEGYYEDVACRRSASEWRVRADFLDRLPKRKPAPAGE